MKLNSERASKIYLLIFISILATLAITYFERSKTYSVDDSFITYRYAYHLMEGKGLVFNLGENYYGTTAAGYAVLLSIATTIATSIKSTITVQNVSVAVSALALSLIAVCAYLMALKGQKNRSISFIAVLGFTFCLFAARPFNEVAGHETYSYLAGALLGTVLASQGRMFIAGIVIAVTTTFRPDAVLFAPIICCTYIAYHKINLLQIFKNSQLWKFTIAFFLIVIPWLGYLQYHFGRAFPGTMDAKKAQILMGYWPNYNLETLANYVTNNISTTLAVIIIIGLISFFAKINILVRNHENKNNDVSQNLFVGICWLTFLLLSVGFYLSINVTFWNWYGIPVVFALSIVSYVGIVSNINSKTTVSLVKNLTTKMIFVCCAVVLFNYSNFSSWFNNPNINPHISAYVEVADYLKEIEPEGTVIEMAEPGSFAMRLGSKFNVVDELGLITPKVATALLRQDFSFANSEYKPEYIICSWPGSYSACSHPDIISKYTLIGDFDRDFWVPHIGTGAKLYKRKE